MTVKLKIVELENVRSEIKVIVDYKLHITWTA